MKTLELADRGKIELPKDARERRGLVDGSVLEFIECKSGDMVLRPVAQAPQLDLIDHLRRFQGVQIQERPLL